MRRTIQVGDTVLVRDRYVNTFRNSYGPDALLPRVVIAEDKACKRRRLHLDGQPNLLWVGQARCVKRPESESR